MSSGRITFLIVVAAVVAIVAVVAANGGVDWPFGGDGTPTVIDTPDRSDEAAEFPAVTEEASDSTEVPDNPDDVHGDDAISLTKPANLRRAMATLDARRRKVEGVFETIRIAPGRIDTIIVHPDDRRTNIQVRNDAQVSFETTHDFPTSADFRERGLTGRDVDPAAPAKMLRKIDRIRNGDAAHDVDYLVVSKGGTLGAYMRIRTARPRMFLQEPGTAIRPIG